MSQDEPKKKKKTLRTSTALQQKTIAKALTGASNRQISRDLGIDRRTVKSILVESNVEEALEQWRNEYRNLIPDALEVQRRFLQQSKDNMMLTKQDFDASDDVLRGTGIHEERTRTREDLHIHDEYKGRSRAEIEAELAERFKPSESERVN